MSTSNQHAFTDLPSTASVKHITLDDGQQASFVIQGGRITKILAANGQVAELSWKDDAAMRIKYHKSPESEQSKWQDLTADGNQGSVGSDSDRIMETPVHEAPMPHSSMHTPPTTSQAPIVSEGMQFNPSGPPPMPMRPNSPEMPTILETNSQASPEHLTPYTAGDHQGSQSTWNPTHSWMPPSSGPNGVSQTPPVGSLTGHYPADKVIGNPSMLHSAPSPAGRTRSQSMPYQKGAAASRASIDAQQRRSYGHNITEEGPGVRFGPETPDPQEPKPRQASPPDSGSSQARADTASSAPAPPPKKLTVWKKLKKALFNPGKSSSSSGKREATAQQLLQEGTGGDTAQRYSDKHGDQSDGAVNYSRKTSFQEARETPAHRHSVDSAGYGQQYYRQLSMDLPYRPRYRQSLDSSYYPGGYYHPRYRPSGEFTRDSVPSSYRQSTDSSHYGQRSVYSQPMDSASVGQHYPHQHRNSYRQQMAQAPPAEPFFDPPGYREAGPSMDGAPSGQLLPYPPLQQQQHQQQQADRRRSGSTVDFGPRRAFAANLALVEPYGSGVQRPTYTQSYAAPDRSGRRGSISTDFSFGAPETPHARPPTQGLPPPAPSQERLRQQQFMRQQFIQQQQDERTRSGSQALSDQSWDPRRAVEGTPMRREGSSGSMTPDRSQSLHSAPHRPSSVDEGRSSGAEGEARRNRRIRTADYSKPTNEAPFSVPAMSGMAGRWVKNLNQGTDGAEVDDLLQLSYLQRLARQKVAEMEIIETMDIFEIVWNIPLNNGHSKIKKSDRYLKNSEVCELPRRDGRQGVLRSQLNFTPEGHVHIRALQGDPFGAVFHDRIKMSTGGHRLKIEQKFQLLAPGVMPIKHHSIWQRIEDTN